MKNEKHTLIEPDRKDRAVRLPVFRSETAFLRMDDLFRERKPDAESVFGVFGSTVKPRENMGQFIFGNTGAGVRNRDAGGKIAVLALRPDRDRPAGSVSKLNTLRDGVRVLMTIFTILRFYKPLLFFSLCSLAVALTGLLLGLPVINEFMETRYVSKVPTAILASSLEVLAMVLFSVGLNLDALAHQRAIELEKTIRQNTSPRSSC